MTLTSVAGDADQVWHLLVARVPLALVADLTSLHAYTAADILAEERSGRI